MPAANVISYPPMRYAQVYRMLKRAGHDPAKAAEIVLDARRHDKHSRAWVGVLYHQRRSL